MADQKQYFPGLFIRARQTQFGEMLGCDFNAAEAIAFFQSHADERGRVRITIAPKRESGKHGTHSAWLDTWRPDPNRAQSAAPRRERPSASDLPPGTVSPRNQPGAVNPRHGNPDPLPGEEQYGEDVPF